MLQFKNMHGTEVALGQLENEIFNKASFNTHQKGMNTKKKSFSVIFI